MIPANLDASILERARTIRLLVLDVDGVLTDGRIVYGETAGEIKNFHVFDGFAIRVLQRFGITPAIISGRSSRVVEMRARELGIDDVYLGNLEKLPAFEALCQRHEVDAADVAAIGDDLPDLPILRRVGLSAAPRNAHPYVSKNVHYHVSRQGGHGAVRELAEVILLAQGKLKAYLERFDR
ncbi:MAG: HAD hydrolase family protein [Planctomycetes bacterium]|nr:HAD hydrolase family protein [Planctomycetota bacterium]